MLALAACGGPQSQTEAAVTYHVKFVAEAGVSTSVTFPFPVDGSHDIVLSNLSVLNDAGTLMEVAVRGDTGDGGDIGLMLSGFGTVEAEVMVMNASGFPSSNGAPDAGLSMQVGDAGVDTHYIRTNKGGMPIVSVTFEYTATRACGGGCGGEKSWTYTGDVGLGPQAVQMTYVENN